MSFYCRNCRRASDEGFCPTCGAVLRSETTGAQPSSRDTAASARSDSSFPYGGLAPLCQGNTNARLAGILGGQGQTRKEDSNA